MPPKKNTEIDVLEERVDSLVKSVDHLQSTLSKNVDELKGLVTAQYVTRHEFNPVKQIVFGVVGALLLAFVGAITALVLKQ